MDVPASEGYYLELEHSWVTIKKDEYTSSIKTCTLISQGTNDRRSYDLRNVPRMKTFMCYDHGRRVVEEHTHL